MQLIQTRKFSLARAHTYYELGKREIWINISSHIELYLDKWKLFSVRWKYYENKNNFFAIFSPICIVKIIFFKHLSWSFPLIFSRHRWSRNSQNEGTLGSGIGHCSLCDIGLWLRPSRKWEPSSGRKMVFPRRSTAFLSMVTRKTPTSYWRSI